VAPLDDPIAVDDVCVVTAKAVVVPLVVEAALREAVKLDRALVTEANDVEDVVVADWESEVVVAEVVACALDDVIVALAITVSAVVDVRVESSDVAAARPDVAAAVDVEAEVAPLVDAAKLVVKLAPAAVSVDKLVARELVTEALSEGDAVGQGCQGWDRLKGASSAVCVPPACAALPLGPASRANRTHRENQLGKRAPAAIRAEGMMVPRWRVEPQQRPQGMGGRGIGGMSREHVAARANGWEGAGRRAARSFRVGVWCGGSAPARPALPSFLPASSAVGHVAHWAWVWPGRPTAIPALALRRHRCHRSRGRTPSIAQPKAWVRRPQPKSIKYYLFIFS
jgi:hypothetical protein